MPKFAPFRLSRYRKAKAKRRARRAWYLLAEFERLKDELTQAYIHAPTYREARLLLQDIWSLDASFVVRR